MARLKPDSWSAHSNLGNAFSMLPGRLDDAIAEYRAALEIRPESAAAHNNLGYALSQKPGSLPDAVHAYREALRLNPDSADAHYNLGAALAQMPGQRRAALAEFEAALRLRPSAQVGRTPRSAADALVGLPEAGKRAGPGDPRGPGVRPTRRYTETVMPNMRRMAMVTGASSGIGAEFARRLSRDGFDLILVARRQELLDQLAREFGGAEILPADLTLPEDLARVEARIASAPELELLVNNAGFGTWGCFWETPLEGQDQMHRLHVMATMRLTRAALARMVPRGHGGVINVASVAGFGQSPGSVSYCATKAWMNSFTEGLDLELRGSGSPVRVQSLCPGFTVTGFHDVMGMSRESIPSWLWMRVEDVVDASLRGLENGKLFVVPGAIYKLIVSLEKLTPRWLRSMAIVAVARRKRRA